MHAIHLHLYYTDLWPEFASLITPCLGDDTHLYVTLTEDDTTGKAEIARVAHKVLVVPNRGLDIGAFIKFWAEIQDKGYSTITKLHGKKSLHHRRPSSFGEIWRRTATAALIGTPEQFRYVTGLALESPKNCFGAQEYVYNYDKDYQNLRYMQEKMSLACEALGISLKTYQREGVRVWTSRGEFIAGTMFCCSTEYISSLFANTNLEVVWENLPPGYDDANSLAHMIERIFGYWAEVQDGFVIGVKKIN